MWSCLMLAASEAIASDIEPLAAAAKNATNHMQIKRYLFTISWVVYPLIKF